MKELIRNTFHLREPQQRRIDYLDYLRGSLMLLVLLQHANVPGSSYILQFHMPALFLLSGYTEFLTNKTPPSLGAFVKSRFFRLIVPYICFELLELVLYGFVCILSQMGLQLGPEQMKFSLPEALTSIAACMNSPYKGLFGRLWFLPAMFCSGLYVYVIKNVIARGNRRFMWVFVPVLLGLSHFSSAYLPFRLPFGMDIGFLGAAFSLLGFLAGSQLKWAINEKHAVWDGVMLLIGAGVVVVCNVVAEPVCLMYQNEYAHFGSMIAAALGYTLILFILCKWTAPALRKIPAVHKLITWYSVHSLATFPVHLTIKIAALVVFKFLGFSHWLLLFGGMLLLNVLVVNFITHYLPFMLGVFKKRPVHEADSK